MATHTDGPAVSSSNQPRVEDGPYILRPLIEDLPLAPDGSNNDIRINCVEYYDGNLYVGTSASEVLHFVQMPPDPNDKSARPTYIQASRLIPVSVETSSTQSQLGVGVQEIVLLPRIGKACILCNSTAAFYSLPELSPVSGISVVKNCNWIGGVDLNEISSHDEFTEAAANDATILLSLKSRIQVVRLADKVLEAPKVTFAGSVLFARRDSIACVADSKAYALLDIYRRLSIPLMNISTLDETIPDEASQTNSVPGSAPSTSSRPESAMLNIDTPSSAGHSRSTSQSNVPSASQDPPTPAPATSPPPLAEPKSTTPPPINKPLPAAPTGDDTSPKTLGSKKEPILLKPHIVSPNPGEFMLVIGTRPLEPGVGMFVSLDGEPTRATVQFERYPESVIIDGGSIGVPPSQTSYGEEDDNHVIASICREQDTGTRHYGIEIQHMNAGQEANPEKYWLEARNFSAKDPYGLKTLRGQGQVRLDEVVSKLSQKRFSPFPSPLETSTLSLRSSDSRTALSMERFSKERELFERDESQDDDSLPEGWESLRTAEGEEFMSRLADAEARFAVWNGNSIWWAIRNPLIIQLDTFLDAACPDGEIALIDRQAIYSVLELIRNRDARTELEYMTLDYLRQKAGLLLLLSLLSSAGEREFSDDELNDWELDVLEKVLVDSKLDPRVVLSLIPGIRNDIIEGRRGIWIYAGVKNIADLVLGSVTFEAPDKETLQRIDLRIMHFFRRFLSAWRKMKGFGSVPDEGEVFKTVDATLLIVLLELDQRSPKTLVKGSAVRAELNDLVDRGVDCFDRAVDVLESYHRLFVLSRLYQSRKMAGDVLATWKRIIEGEGDRMHEFQDGEQRVRDYLKKISSKALVREYGVWLANRNPQLGVQVFAEDEGRAPKFEPEQAVEILREEAPGAVKYFLEQLVFDKGLTSYVNELLKYYLDIVLEDLQTLATSREAVMAAYDAYRALQAPKPTYHDFLTENAPPNDDVWKSRLRLLQLLGGPHDYDTTTIMQRIASVPGDLLVPETIILAGRQHHHEEALRLLVHRLGDYDTAVSYCLRGGSSIYARPHGRPRVDSVPEVEQQRRLFQVVLREFLDISDIGDRVEQTGALLERFGGWFDVEEVLSLIPDTWSVNIIAGFLISALRRLVRDKHESTVRKSLSGAENLRVSHDLVIHIKKGEPTIEA